MAQSGAGAEVTALYESLQAYACAARQAKGSALESIFELKASNTKNADCDRTLKKCLDQFSGDEAYQYSIIETANKFFKDYKITSGYKFHRGGTAVDKIYSNWRKFKSGSGISGDDKWNPADIWAIKGSYTQKSNSKNLGEYNEFILDSYNKKKLIGISLKKVPRGVVKTEVYNDGKSELKAKFKEVKPMTDVTASKDVYIVVNSKGKNIDIQLRNFSSRPVTSSWQGEIKGKSAAGGKIGGGVLTEQALGAGVKMDPPSKFNASIKPSDTTLKTFAKMYKKINPKGKETEKEVMTKAKSLAKVDPTWWMSKYLGVYYVYEVIKSGKKDRVASRIYQYASSASESSSVFVKYHD